MSIPASVAPPQPSASRDPDDKTLLRFITCGSVDAGKSTLIGRLLYDGARLCSDQLAALQRDSGRIGTHGPDLDFALLVDGLAAEREQGITIDVAYRFFATDRRKFIVADTPGHEQYTRNMVTGASTAQAAVILLDARKGLLTQTRRHSHLVRLLGIRHVIFVVNKLDLVAYSESVFTDLAAECKAFASMLGFEEILAIPCSALKGDNITSPSHNTSWYDGPTLLQALEGVDDDDSQAGKPFHLPVQWVDRSAPGFRGYSGLVMSGCIAVGDRVRITPTGTQTCVSRIVTFDGDLDFACAGDSVTLTLADEVDVSRGDVISTALAPLGVADQFEADVIWMDDTPLVPGRHYLIKIGAQTVGATLSVPKHRLDVNSMTKLAAKTLRLNEIGVCILSVDHPVPFASYVENRDLGGFLVIDRLSNATVAAGLLRFALRRSQNVHWQHLEVNKAA